MAQFNPDLLLKDELSYEALLRGLPPVSYTHLDVYKRQILYFAQKLPALYEMPRYSIKCLDYILCR